MKYVITSTAAVQGFNAPADFVPAAQRSFEAGMATQLAIAVADVNVTGVTTIRRRLMSGVSVAFAVSSPTLMGASALKNLVQVVNASAIAVSITAATNISTSVGSISVPTDPVVTVLPAEAVNLTSITNVTMAAAQVSAGLQALVSDAASFSLAQQSILSGLTSNTQLSSADAGTTVALVLAVLTVNSTLQLTPEVQTAALAALQNVAGSIDFLGGGVAGSNVVSALSAVASSAVTQGGEANSASALALTAISLVQVSILGSLAGATNSTQQVDSQTASQTAELVLAVLSVAPSVPLSPAVQMQALAALQNVAGAPLNLTADSGGNVVGALSAVATSAIVQSSGSGAMVSSATLGSVSRVLDSLTSRQTAALLGSFSACQSPPPPLSFSTPAIQSLVRVDAALPTAALTVNGSASRFDPLPDGLLAVNASAAGVVTQFRSLTFDPYGGAGTNGSTRLAFTDANGTEFVIANLSAPIRFQLPSLAGLADGSRAQCQFWDPSALAYSTRGCQGIPDPQPPGHVLSWVDGFNASSDADMARAWQVTGPLMAGCAAVVLDCSAEQPGVVFPNLRAPFETPRLECNSTLSTAPMLVFTGSSCALIQPGNAYNCAWNNSAQAFTGAGCVASGGPVRCACRHLTDFACASKPSIPTVSLQDLISLSPSDIITKLKMLFEIVIILFCLMNLGAAIGYILDSRERSNFLQHLQSPTVGFHVAPASGAWLWAFSLEPLRGELDAPTGPAVALSALLGIPVIRLRAALPDELLTWDFATALGRKHVCSVAGFNQSLPLLASLLPPLLGAPRKKTARGSTNSQTGGSSCSGAASPPASPVFADYGMAGVEPFESAVSRHSSVRFSRGLSSTTEAAKTLEDFVGTALVLAFIQVAQLRPAVELAAKVSAAAAHFAGITTPAERDFRSTQTDFVTMLSSGVLNIEHRWLQRARLFKLILSQASDGSWGVSSTTAFALEARPSSETKRLPRQLLVRLSEMLSGAEAMEEDDHDMLQGSGRGDSSAVEHIFQAGAREPRASLSDMHQGLTDCPITCPKEAITDSMPRALRALDADAQAARVWCTLCCIAVLQRLNVCWIAGDGDLYEPTEETIVDSAFLWLAALAAEQPELAAALESGAILKEARRVTEHWHQAFEQRVGDLRRSEAIRALMNRSHVQRTFISLTRAVVTKHDTLSTFLSEPLDGLQRWQMFMIIITLVFSQLLVNIWMFYAKVRAAAQFNRLMHTTDVSCSLQKAVNCCAEVVAILDSGPDGGNCPEAGNCRGFNGTCADVVQQFVDVPILPEFPAGLADYTCDAFPMDSKPVDRRVYMLRMHMSAAYAAGLRPSRCSFVVGLISLAVGLPVVLFLQTAFAIANDSEAPESWLEWPFTWRKLVFGFNGATLVSLWNYFAVCSCLRMRYPSRFMQRTASGTTAARKDCRIATSAGSCAPWALRPPRRPSTWCTARLLPPPAPSHPGPLRREKRLKTRLMAPLQRRIMKIRQQLPALMPTSSKAAEAPLPKRESWRVTSVSWQQLASWVFISAGPFSAGA